MAIGDLNGDELPDLYFTGNMAGDRLYINRGALHFEEATIKSGILKSNLWTTGVTFVDINDDGWLDIYVCRSGTGNFRTNLLYINQQNGRFVERAKAYGLDDNGYSVQSYFFDYDLDGDLDLYLVNHSNRFFEGQEQLFALKNNPSLEEADKLYRNNGNGTFEDVSRAAGIHHFAFGLSAAIADFNDDSYPDIYAASDFFEPDFLYLNNGDGTFSNRLAELLGHTSFSSMGSDAADWNNDGLTDLFVCDMQARDNYRKKANMASMDIGRFRRIVQEGYHYQYMQNTLQLNTGNGRFSEIAELAGVSETDWSWAPLFLDVDNDGWKDLFVSNGIRRDIQFKDVFTDLQKQGVAPNQISPLNIIEHFPVQKLRNYLFQNNRDLTFKDQSMNWGVDFAGFSTGAAYGDLDLDGDLDLILNNIDDVASVYENLSAQSGNHNFIQITLKGVAGNRHGIGTKVRIRTSQGQQYQHVQPSRGFQSSTEPLLHFGLGDAEQIDELEVQWPDGNHSLQTDIAVNQRIEIAQEATTPLANNQRPATLFREVTEAVGIPHQHREEIYDDFMRELLLPHKYSQLGPGLAAGDVNGDGLDDVFLGGASGYAGRLYLQQRSGTFKLASGSAWNRHRDYEDTGAEFFDADADGDLDLYVASGSNEWAVGSANYRDRLYLNNGKGGFSHQPEALPDVRISSTAIAPADLDGDGDLDLFIGGRLQPGQYPLPASSFIFRNEGGRFSDVTEEVAPILNNIGMVTDGVWMNIDGDHDADLVLTGEWMPITVLTNHDGQLKPQPGTGLEQTHGWWYALAAKDFDGDGDVDLLAGNLGLNYKYRATADEPFQVYAHDFDNSGSLDIVLSYYNDGALYPLRGRQCSSQQMPALSEQFPTYAAFATSSLTEVYGAESLAAAYRAQARTFASAYIENLGDGRFQSIPLPMPAQFSSVNDFLIDDFDADGNWDVLLAGNMYESEVETARNDAGQGLLLRGNGDGSFTPVSPHTSGFRAPGNVKNMVQLQTESGRPLIIVGNNNDFVQVFLL